MDLSHFFITKSQATDFSVGLATLSEMLYRTDFSLEQALMEIFGMKKKDLFLSLLREYHILQDSPSGLKDFITTIQTTIAQLPVFSLTIAFEPKEQTLKALANWFALQIKKQVLFDFTVDASLIAGATFTYNGQFKDYSVKVAVVQALQKLLTQKTPNQSGQNLNSSSSTGGIPSPVNSQKTHQSLEHFTLGR